MFCFAPGIGELSRHEGGRVASPGSGGLASPGAVGGRSGETALEEQGAG